MSVVVSVIDHFNYAYSVQDQYRHFCHNTQEFHPDLDIDPRKYVMEAVNRTIAALKQGGAGCAWKVSLYA